MVHTCFPACKTYADCLLGFEDDMRPQCTSQSQNDGLYCLIPDLTPCENFITASEICLDSAKTICIDLKFIALGVIIGNILQLVFEASMLAALEVTFKPTSLDKLQNPDKYQDDPAQEANPDQKKELDCSVVMKKCTGELLFIGSYLMVAAIFVFSLTYSINYGNPFSIVVEFVVAWAIDQAKSPFSQLITYWVVVRRLGFYENAGFQEWNDEEVAEAGPKMSLYFLMRKTVAEFLELRIVSRFILGMVILLCIVILSELSLTAQISNSLLLTNFYYMINYVLLAFFVFEIMVKIFAYGFMFLSEFINIFDATIVIVSFVMQALNLQAKALGILRVLRLIKVIIEMKKVADQKKLQQQLIKEQKRQGSQIASYVERVLDFLEKLAENADVPKHLREDIQWAVDVISANKLYAGGLEGFKIAEDKVEVRAWTDLIALRNLP